MLAGGATVVLVVLTHERWLMKLIGGEIDLVRERGGESDSGRDVWFGGARSRGEGARSGGKGARSRGEGEGVREFCEADVAEADAEDGLGGISAAFALRRCSSGSDEGDRDDDGCS